MAGELRVPPDARQLAHARSGSTKKSVSVGTDNAPRDGNTLDNDLPGACCKPRRERTDVPRTLKTILGRRRTFSDSTDCPRSNEEWGGQRFEVRGRSGQRPFG